MTGWIDGPMLGFDTECTGVEVETDHILSASLVHVHLRPGDKLQRHSVQAHTEFINPGVPIPPSATAIHGLTDEFIATAGGDPAEVLEGIVLVIKAVLEEGTPLVGMNIPYDLTILDRNCRRHGVTTLSQRLDGKLWPCIDVMVLDKAVDPYRKGSGMRKLGAICPLYRVDPGTAHDSQSDALAACRIAWRIGRMYPKLGALSAIDVHQLQQAWKVEQDLSFAAWLTRQNKDCAGVDGQWPIRALPTAQANDASDKEEGRLVSLW